MRHGEQQSVREEGEQGGSVVKRVLEWDSRSSLS